MRLDCLSFVAGLPDAGLLANRFKSQALATEFFDKVSVVSDDSDPIFNSFYSKHRNFVESHKRGYGYWLWKPFIVLEYAKRLRSGDTIFYCDIGCEFSLAGRERFNNLVSLSKHQPIVAFEAGARLFEHQWSKPALLDYLSVPTVDCNSPQIAATFFFIQVNSFTLALLEEWYYICTLDDCKFLVDDNDIAIDYIEHRHDQSIFSLLLKKYKISPHRMNSNFPIGLYYSNSYVYSFPIHAIRNLTPTSRIVDSERFIGCTALVPFLKFYLKFFIFKLWSFLSVRSKFF